MSRNGKRLDPRVLRTRRLLRNALWELIPEIGYDAITIQDITDRATLNRTTFYLHYKDKADLLYHGMEEVMNELTGQDPLPTVVGGQVTMQETQQTIVSDLNHIADNFSFYQAMLGFHGVWGFYFRLQEYFYETTANRLVAILGELPSGPVATEFVLNYIAASYLGVIRWWINHDMPHPPEEIARQLVWIYSFGVYEALGLDVDRFRV